MADSAVRALAALPARHRQVLLRAYRDGVTTRDIAAELDIPDHAVKSIIHEILWTLRTLMPDD